MLAVTGIYRSDDCALDLLVGLLLPLLLAMIVMTLKLWGQIELGGPIVGILLVQTVAMLCHVLLGTFRVTGRNGDLTLLATDPRGFARGWTATALGGRVPQVERLRRAGAQQLVGRAGRLVCFNAQRKLMRDCDATQWDGIATGALKSKSVRPQLVCIPP